MRRCRRWRSTDAASYNGFPTRAGGAPFPMAKRAIHRLERCHSVPATRYTPRGHASLSCPACQPQRHLDRRRERHAADRAWRGDPDRRRYPRHPAQCRADRAAAGLCRSVGARPARTVRFPLPRALHGADPARAGARRGARRARDRRRDRAIPPRRDRGVARDDRIGRLARARGRVDRRAILNQAALDLGTAAGRPAPQAQGRRTLALHPPPRMDRRRAPPGPAHRVARRRPDAGTARHAHRQRRRTTSGPTRLCPGRARGGSRRG